MKVLVTGVNGFVGKHLARALHEQGHEAMGTGYGDLQDDETRELLSSYTAADLTKPDDVAALPLAEAEAVINLAGLAQIGASFKDPEIYKKVNVAVLTVLGERLLKVNPSARVVAVSTGAVYAADQPMPLTEDSRTIGEGGSPYALSKLQMEAAARDLKAQGLNCVIVRPFNHSGPGQLPGFIIPDLYQKIRQAKEDGRPIKVGNLDARRDYTDVRDIVGAYINLATAENPSHDIYNVCSGTSRSGREILDLLLKAMELEGKVTTEIDKSLLRPNDPPELRGSAKRLHAETGWAPAIPFEQTINDFVAGHA